MIKKIQCMGPIIACSLCLSPFAVARAGSAYPIVDTGQKLCYDNTRQIPCPQPQHPFYGQDAHYNGKQPSYTDNGDGTIADNITGLMWSKSVDEIKLSLSEAEEKARQMTLGGYRDWRVPTIKELYSLIDFQGNTGTPERSGFFSSPPPNAIPYINTDYFDFRYGNTSAGERYIDAQWLSSTQYVSVTMGQMQTLFGVNFADGRIKGYGYQRQGSPLQIKKFYVRYVRGDNYGQNDFKDNGDGTITDRATGLMWMQMDSARAMNWEDALKYASSMQCAGYDDWRLPNAKELQSIVDYTRSPETTQSAAIEPVFKSTAVLNEAGKTDYGFYWTSTTHLEGPQPIFAVYIAFGRALGQMHGQTMDVHGAGSQRSDPKTGQAELGMGPQGDARRVLNLLRLVRGGDVIPQPQAPDKDMDMYPNTVHVRTDFSDQATEDLRHSLQERPRFSALQHRELPQGRERQYQGGDNGMSIPLRPPMDGQGPAGTGRPIGENWIKRLDRDGDGKISISEFDGPKRHFSDFDTNRDGYITAPEAPTGPPPGVNRP